MRELYCQDLQFVSAAIFAVLDIFDIQVVHKNEYRYIPSLYYW